MSLMLLIYRWHPIPPFWFSFLSSTSRFSSIWQLNICHQPQNQVSFQVASISLKHSFWTVLPSFSRSFKLTKMAKTSLTTRFSTVFFLNIELWFSVTLLSILLDLENLINTFKTFRLFFRMKRALTVLQMSPKSKLQRVKPPTSIVSEEFADFGEELFSWWCSSDPFDWLQEKKKTKLIQRLKNDSVCDKKRLK